MKRLLASILILPMLVLPVQAETIKWVDFNVSYESMKYALDQDIATFEQEKHISWIDILALAACRTGGKCALASVKQAVADLKKDKQPEQLLGDLYKYYDYYHRAYTAALGGLVGSYAIEKDGQWVATYGLKAFSPIAAGYGYSHCDDFGVARSFGFRREHLGNDLMGALGTPVVAVEGGVVEAMGWNRYGGWRVGIRSFDSRRYYYYAHLQKDTPFAPGLAEGPLPFRVQNVPPGHRVPLPLMFCRLDTPQTGGLFRRFLPQFPGLQGQIRSFCEQKRPPPNTKSCGPCPRFCGEAYNIQKNNKKSKKTLAFCCVPC